VDSALRGDSLRRALRGVLRSSDVELRHVLDEAIGEAGRQDV
jgi:hypothetical protein